MFANPITKKIEMTKTEAAKAGKFGTKEFEELGALMDRFSSYEIVVVKLNGDDIKTVQNNLGHATASFTLDVYGHVTEQMKRDSSSRMEPLFKGFLSCGKVTVRLRFLKPLTFQRKTRSK